MMTLILRYRSLIGNYIFEYTSKNAECPDAEFQYYTYYAEYGCIYLAIEGTLVSERECGWGKIASTTLNSINIWFIVINIPIFVTQSSTIISKRKVTSPIIQYHTRGNSIPQCNARLRRNASSCNHGRLPRSLVGSEQALNNQSYINSSASSTTTHPDRLYSVDKIELLLSIVHG